MTKSTEVNINIILHKEQPIYANPHSLPFAHREIVDQQVQAWINDDIVKPCVLEYASPVVLTTKKDGSP